MEILMWDAVLLNCNCLVLILFSLLILLSSSFLLILWLFLWLIFLNLYTGTLGDSRHVFSIKSLEEFLMLSFLESLLAERWALDTLVRELLSAHIFILNLVEDFVNVVLLILGHNVLGKLALHALIPRVLCGNI